MFEFIKKKLLAPKVKEFVTDFEMGVWKAVEKCFPKKTSHRGCGFHWAQAIMKRLKDRCGLFPLYLKNRTVKNIIQELMCLCYIKHTEIPGLFRELRAALPNRQRKQGLSKKTRKGLKQLFDYVDRNWVSKGYWSPEKWSIYYISIRYVNFIIDHKLIKTKIKYFFF